MIRNKKKESLDILKNGLRVVLRDHQLTVGEINEFWHAHDRLGLTLQDSEDIRAIAFAEQTNAALADGLLSSHEIGLLNTILTGLRVPPSHPYVQQAMARIHRCQLIHQIASGQLPQLAYGQCSLNLQANEIAHVQLAASLLEDRVVRSGYVGGYSGFSFRIAKGVRWHVGGSRGQSVSERAIVPVSQGYLCLTNQRIVFLGNPKSIEMKWAKILGVVPYEDGLQVQVSNRSKSPLFQFSDPFESEVAAVICDRYLNS